MKKNIPISEEEAIDFDKLKWGSFTKQMKDFQKKHPNKVKDLKQFSEFVLKNPDEFIKRTADRARFYQNVILPKKEGGGFTDKQMVLHFKRMKKMNPELSGGECCDDCKSVYEKKEGKGRPKTTFKDRPKMLEHLKDYLKDKQKSKTLLKEAKTHLKGMGYRGGALKASDIKSMLDASYDKKKSNIGDFVIDPELSDKRVKVYKNTTNNQVVVAHRGSADWRDWLDNFSLFKTGRFKSTGTYKEHKKKQDAAIKKYGAENITSIGHSRAGGYVEKLNEDTPVNEVITYNKATNWSDVGRVNPSNQYDIRSDKDPVSALNFTQFHKNDTISTKAGFNPLTAHGTSSLTQLGDELIGKGYKGGKLNTKKLSVGNMRKFLKTYHKDKKIKLPKALGKLKKPELGNMLKDILKSDQELSGGLMACNANGKNCVDVRPQYLPHFEGGRAVPPSEYPTQVEVPEDPIAFQGVPPPVPEVDSDEDDGMGDVDFGAIGEALQAENQAYAELQGNGYTRLIGGSNETSSDFPPNMNMIDTNADGDVFSGEYYDGYSDLPSGYYEDFGFTPSSLPYLDNNDIEDTIPSGGSIPIDKHLYKRAKEMADDVFEKPSAFKSGYIVKKYKDLGGRYRGQKPRDQGLTRWFKEEWGDIGDRQYPVFRPTKRITSDTPLLPSEIDPKNLKRMIDLKQKYKGERNLPPFKEKSEMSGGANRWTNFVKQYATAYHKTYGCALSDGQKIKDAYKKFKEGQDWYVKPTADASFGTDDDGFNVPEPFEEPVKDMVDDIKDKVEELGKLGKEKGAVSYNANTIVGDIAYVELIKKYGGKCYVIYKDLIGRQQYGLSINTNFAVGYGGIPTGNYLPILDKMEECVKRGVDLVLIPLHLRFGTSHSGHANMLIYRPKFGIVERFEPHGQAYGNSEKENNAFNKILTEIFEGPGAKTRLGKIRYKEPFEICPMRKKGFQSLEGSLSSLRSEGGGFCMMWSLFLMEMIFLNPTLSTKEVIDKVFDITKEQPEYLKDVIRGYVLMIEEQLDDLIKLVSEGKKGFTFKQSGYSQLQKDKEVEGFLDKYLVDILFEEKKQVAPKFDLPQEPQAQEFFRPKMDELPEKDKIIAQAKLALDKLTKSELSTLLEFTSKNSIFTGKKENFVRVMMDRTQAKKTIEAIKDLLNGDITKADWFSGKTYNPENTMDKKQYEKFEKLSDKLKKQPLFAPLKDVDTGLFVY